MDNSLSNKIQDIEKKKQKADPTPLWKKKEKKKFVSPTPAKEPEPEPELRDEWDEGEETGFKVIGIVFIAEIMVMLALISACCVKLLFGL